MRISVKLAIVSQFSLDGRNSELMAPFDQINIS
jgi:hypothetical protein